MDKTHCFYIITTAKPNIRVNRRGAVLPQARGRFAPGLGQDGFIGAHFKLPINYVFGHSIVQRLVSYTKYIYLNTINAQLCIDKLRIQNTQLFP